MPTTFQDATKFEDIIDLSDESMKTMATSGAMLSDVAPAEVFGRMLEAMLQGDDMPMGPPLTDAQREAQRQEEHPEDSMRGCDVFGRMSEGMDESDFDFMKPYRMLETGVHEGGAGDELDLMAEPDPMAHPASPIPAEEAVAGEVLNSHRKWKRAQRRQAVLGEDTYSSLLSEAGRSASDSLQRQAEADARRRAMPDVLDPYPARMPEVLDPYLGDEIPSVFESPTEEQFPVLTKAIRHFQAAESKPKVVRIDTDKTYDQFVSNKAFDEIVRRVSELRAAIEEHLDAHEREEHPGYHHERKQLRKWEEIVSGDVQTLSSAKTAADALEAMPKVPLDLPPFAEGSIKCWRDGDAVICSIRFGSVTGPRVATMSAKPQVDVDDVARRALKAGVDPAVVLGALPDLADAACAKRLVRDIAGAALQAQRRHDVCGMDDDDEPLLLTSGGTDEGAAPLAALMHVEQRADAGDPQAKAEMRKLRVAAQTPSGQKIAAPLLTESSKRLSVARASRAEKPSLLQRYWGAI